MAEAKYKYNTKTLSYERIETTVKDRLIKVTTFFVGGILFATVFILISYAYFDSPKEKKLIRENEFLALQYDFISKRINELDLVLEDLQHRDDNIYRVIFEADPIPENIRKAGIGGINRYKSLANYESSELVIKAVKAIDQLSKQLYIQSKSFDEVYNLAIQKEKMLASIPAIQPVSNEDLTRMASGYGFRIHPRYKTRLMHYGMDFTATTGTEIYATGNGVIQLVKRSRRGFGNHVVINHGYGYETLYGHMSSYIVKKGQKVKRGEIIGFVGNSGLSTGPHLHYEVHKNGRKINPVNFYFNDLSPKEYEQMILLSSTANQSFD